MAVDEDVALCGSCKNQVNDKDEPFLCDGIREICFHANCVKVSSEQFQVCLTSSGCMKGVCDPCDTRLLYDQ